MRVRWMPDDEERMKMRKRGGGLMRSGWLN